MERVVQVTHDGQVYTFRVDRYPLVAFWRVEAEGRVQPLPLRALGTEQPAFFRWLAEWAATH